MPDSVFSKDQATNAIGILKTLPEGSTVFLVRSNDHVWTIRAPVPSDEKDIDAAARQLIQSLKLIAPTPDTPMSVMLAGWLGNCMDRAIETTKAGQNDLTWPQGYIFSRAYVLSQPGEKHDQVPNFVMAEIIGDDIQVKPLTVSITEAPIQKDPSE